MDPASDDVESILVIDVFGPEPAAYRYRIADNVAHNVAEQGRETLKLLHLNDDVELAKARMNAVAKTVRELTSDSEAVRLEGRRRMSRFRPFGGAIRSVVSQRNPALLPDAAEELRWFVDDLLEILDLLDAVERPDARIRDITRYALAALWRDPPAASSNAVKEWIRSRGRYEEIMPFYNRLGRPRPQR